MAAQPIPEAKATPWIPIEEERRKVKIVRKLICVKVAAIVTYIFPHPLKKLWVRLVREGNI